MDLVLDLGHIIYSVEYRFFYKEKFRLQERIDHFYLSYEFHNLPLCFEGVGGRRHWSG